MRYVAFAALLAGTVVATPAFAQDVPNNSGFHIDGIVGWDHARANGEHANGVAYGAGVGYDLQSGRAIFGVEAEASDSSADRCVSGSIIAGDRACASFGRDLYAGGRVGYLIGNHSLLYVKAGYTNARATLSYDDGTAATNLDFVDHRDLDGVRAGAGLQIGVGDHAYIRTEYRYSNYQDGVDRHQVIGGFGVRF